MPQYPYKLVIGKNVQFLNIFALHSKAMVLRSNHHCTIFKVLYRMVCTVVTMWHFHSSSARS